MRTFLDPAERDGLLRRFRSLHPETPARWPEHASFGAMTRQRWGCFCYRHFDYHLRQFGA